MKKNEKIRTPLGIISVFKNEIPERYHCVVEPESLRISETHIRILTIDTFVGFLFLFPVLLFFQLFYFAGNLLKALCRNYGFRNYHILSNLHRSLLCNHSALTEDSEWHCHSKGSMYAERVPVCH